MILAILNLYVAQMSSIKFWSNLTWFGRKIRLKLWPPSWTLERNNFSNSESLCHCDASNQLLAQSELWFGRRWSLKNFMIAAMAILDIGTEQF